MRFTKPIKRILASFITFAFLVTNTFLPVPNAGAESIGNPFLPVLAPPPFELPTELGEVTDVGIRASGPQLIHIQTVHRQYESQKKIQAILEILEKNYGVKLLLLEGAGNRLQPELFRFFPENPERNQKRVDELVREGDLTGPEAFLIDSTREAEGFGVEEVEPYRKNWNALKEMVAHRRDIDQFLQTRRAELEQTRCSRLNKNLRYFLRRKAAFESKNLSFAEWLAFLKNHSDIDFENPEHQIEWPMMVRYAKLAKAADGIDPKQLEKEKEDFLKEIGKYVRSSDFSRFFGANKFATTNVPNPRFLFERLLDHLPENFRLDAWPNLQLHIQQIIFTSELESKRFFQEQEKLADRLTQSMAKTEEEKKILGELHEYRLLKKLLNLELTREEWEIVCHSRESGNDKQMHCTRAIAFYTAAVERESHMMKKALARMRQSKEKRAVLITGGFHTGGIKQLAADAGLGYVQITPKVTELREDAKEIYLKALSGTETVSQSHLEILLRTDPRFSFDIDPGYAARFQGQSLGKVDQSNIATLVDRYFGQNQQDSELARDTLIRYSYEERQLFDGRIIRQIMPHLSRANDLTQRKKAIDLMKTLLYQGAPGMLDANVLLDFLSAIQDLLPFSKETQDETVLGPDEPFWILETAFKESPNLIGHPDLRARLIIYETALENFANNPKLSKYRSSIQRALKIDQRIHELIDRFARDAADANSLGRISEPERWGAVSGRSLGENESSIELLRQRLSILLERAQLITDRDMAAGIDSGELPRVREEIAGIERETDQRINGLERRLQILGTQKADVMRMSGIEPTGRQSMDQLILQVEKELAALRSLLHEIQETKQKWMASSLGKRGPDQPDQAEEGSEEKSLGELAAATSRAGLIGFSLLGTALAGTAIVFSQLIYTPAFHFLGQLAVMLLATSLFGLLHNLAPPQIKKKLSEPSALLLLSLPMHFLIRMISVFRYPWMDETNYSINGIMGLWHNEWKQADSGLVTLWDVPAGLMAHFIHPVAGPRVLAALFSAGTVYMVYHFVKGVLPYFNSSFHSEKKETAAWLAFIGSLLFGLAGTTIYTGSLATHDVMGVFLMMAGSALMLNAFSQKEPGEQKFRLLVSHILLLLGMLTNYALFIFGPFFALFGAFLYWAQNASLSFAEAAKGALKKHVLPLFATFLVSFALFHAQILPAIKVTYAINEVIWFYVFFPAYLLAAEMAMGIGIYAAGALTSVKKVLTNKSLAVVLFVGSLSSMFYHLWDGQLQGMVKHYTATLALMSPLVILGFYQFWEYIQEKIKSPWIRAAVLSASALLLINGFSQANAPGFVWWGWGGWAGSATAHRTAGPEATEDRGQVSPDWSKGLQLYSTPLAALTQEGLGNDTPLDQAIRALRQLNLGDSEWLASRDKTNGFLAGVHPGNIFVVNLDMDPQTVIDDPRIVAVEVYPEYEAKGWIERLREAGFEAVSGIDHEGAGFTLMVHPARRSAMQEISAESLGEDTSLEKAFPLLSSPYFHDVMRGLEQLDGIFRSHPEWATEENREKLMPLVTGTAPFFAEHRLFKRKFARWLEYWTATLWVPLLLGSLAFGIGMRGLEITSFLYLYFLPLFFYWFYTFPNPDRVMTRAAEILGKSYSRDENAEDPAKGIRLSQSGIFSNYLAGKVEGNTLIRTLMKDYLIETKFDLVLLKSLLEQSDWPGDRFARQHYLNELFPHLSSVDPRQVRLAVETINLIFTWNSGLAADENKKALKPLIEDTVPLSYLAQAMRKASWASAISGFVWGVVWVVAVILLAASFFDLEYQFLGISHRVLKILLTLIFMNIAGVKIIKDFYFVDASEVLKIKKKAEEIWNKSYSGDAEGSGASLGESSTASKPEYPSIEMGRRFFIAGLVFAFASLFRPDEAMANVVVDPELPPEWQRVLALSIPAAIEFLTWPARSDDPEVRHLSERAGQLLKGEEVKFIFSIVSDLAEGLAGSSHILRDEYGREIMSQGEARALLQKIGPDEYLITFDVAGFRKGMAHLILGLAHEIVSHFTVDEDFAEGTLSPFELETLAFRREIKFVEALLADPDLITYFGGSANPVLNELRSYLVEEKELLALLEIESGLNGREPASREPAVGNREVEEQPVGEQPAVPERTSVLSSLPLLGSLGLGILAIFFLVRHIKERRNGDVSRKMSRAEARRIEKEERKRNKGKEGKTRGQSLGLDLNTAKGVQASSLGAESSRLIRNLPPRIKEFVRFNERAGGGSLGTLRLPPQIGGVISPMAERMGSAMEVFEFIRTAEAGVVGARHRLALGRPIGSPLQATSQTKRRIFDDRALPGDPRLLEALIQWLREHPDVQYTLLTLESPGNVKRWKEGLALPENFGIMPVASANALRAIVHKLVSRDKIPSGFVSGNPRLLEKIGVRPGLLRVEASAGDPVLLDAAVIVTAERLLKALPIEDLIRVHQGEDLASDGLWAALVARLRDSQAFLSAA